MPTYEYRCADCGEHVEVVQRFSDEPLTTCPACGGPLKRVFSSVGIILKGSGFYRTDSRKGGRTGRGSSGESAKEDRADKADKPDKAGKSDKTGETGKAGSTKTDSSAGGSARKDSSTKVADAKSA